MKKHALIHLVIVIIAVQAMYEGLSYFAINIYSFIEHLFYPAEQGSNYASPFYFLASAMSMLLGYILLVKSAAIAEFIGTKSGLPDSLRIKTNLEELLCLLIIFLSLGRLLLHLPYFINDIVTEFMSKASRHGTEDVYRNGVTYKGSSSTLKWTILILQLVIPLLMLIYSRAIAGYIARRLGLQNNISLEEETNNEEPINDD